MARTNQVNKTVVATAEPTIDERETTRLLNNEALESRAGDDRDGSDNLWDGLKDFEGLSWWQRPSVFWILAPFTLFTLAFGGIIVPRLNLILDLVCKQYFADQKVQDPDAPFNPVLPGGENPQCKIPEVQRNVSTFMLVMNLATGIMSAIVAPRLGHLSDRYGRTKLMAFASVGGVLGEITTVLAAQYPNVINYRWLILGSIFEGLTGSFTAGNVMSQSYTSDCTPPSRRAVNMGYMHACLFVGLAFGPLLGGYFVKWTGSLIYLFYVVIGCHVFFILFVGLVVPESLSKKKQLAAREAHRKEQEMRSQVPTSWGSGLMSANLLGPLKVLWPTGPGTSRALRRNLVALALTDVIILGSAMAAGAVIILYSGYIFNWGTLESSQFVSALSLTRVFMLMGVYPLINYFGRTRPAARRREAGLSVRHVGADKLDLWVLRLALFSDILAATGYILARSGQVFFASGMLAAFGGLAGATSGSVITKHVPAERVGQVLGAIGMVHALARVLGPALFNGLYAATVEVFPQAIFVLLVSLFAIALAAAFVVKPHVHWEEDPQDEREPLNPQVDPALIAINEEENIRFQ